MSYFVYTRQRIVGLWYSKLILVTVLVDFQLWVVVERLILTIPSKSDSSCSKTMLYLRYEPLCLARMRTGDFMIRLRMAEFGSLGSGAYYTLLYCWSLFKPVDGV